MVTNQIKENPYKTYVKHLFEGQRETEKAKLHNEINNASYASTLTVQERIKHKLDIIKQVELEEEMVRILTK